MPEPLKSRYAIDGVADVDMNLSMGSLEVTATLTAELSDTETDKMLISDGGLAEKSGTVVIEDEKISYHVYDRHEPGVMIDLARGQEGTTPATHAVDTPIRIYGRPRYGNPAIPDSIMAMQTKLAELEARIVALETP